MDGAAVKLTVVGNGVSGSSVAREAHRRGHYVRLVAEGKPVASLAALAVLRKSYVSTEVDGSAAVDYALSEYAKAGCEIRFGAEVTGPHYRNRPEEDWAAVDPMNWLLPAETQRVEPGWEDPEADWTIHCTGYGLEGTRVWGATWYHRDPGALDFDGLRVLRYAPYRTVDAVRYRSGCRLGSSTGKDREAAQLQARRQFMLAGESGWVLDAEGWVLLTGIRLKRTPWLTGFGGPSSAVSFGGFHRSGWSLAPLRASQLLDDLEK